MPKDFPTSIYVKFPNFRTFLDVPVGDADDALAAIAPHEVGVAAVVEQREGGVDGGAERDLEDLKRECSLFCLKKAMITGHKLIPWRYLRKWQIGRWQLNLMGRRF